MPEPYPENVPGDFYVKLDCCTQCDVPRIYTPDLFAYTTGADGHDHCYVSKQPEDDDELEAMLQVIQCAELSCIHYRGNEPEIIDRISTMGEISVCDAVIQGTTERKRPWWRFW